jgi:hypothetical protein
MLDRHDVVWAKGAIRHPAFHDLHEAIVAIHLAETFVLDLSMSAYGNRALV